MSATAGSCNVGLVGPGVMGRNLALNMADHGYRVAVLNRSHNVTGEFLAEHRDDARPAEGGLVGSADTAKRRAEERAHPVAAELALYVVHGTLHLLGMDDATEQEAMKMHEMEDEILAAIGVGRVYGG